MGIAERKEREKNERRNAILSSAREIILLNGVEHASMAEIARVAELSKATLYLYFPNKEAIFNEICEEAARGFLERLQSMPSEGLGGMGALRSLWRGYSEMFGNGDEMLVIFQVRSYMRTWIPSDPRAGEIKSPHVSAILECIYGMIERCKADGLFDPGLDPADAVGLILSTFSSIIGAASRLPREARNPQAMLGEMTKTFQVIIRGLAREGVGHSLLDLTGTE